MAHIHDAARVAENCTTTNGDVTLTGAYTTAGMSAADNRTFSSAMSTSDTCEVVIVNSDGAWQRFIATLSASTTLQRTTFLESSTGSNVTFGAGSKVVYLVTPQSTPVYKNSGDVSSLNVRDAMLQRWAPTGTKTLTVTGWAPSGLYSHFTIKGINLAAATLTWPSWNWIKPDGTFTTSISTYLTAWSITLQTSGTDWIDAWTDDGGTTVYSRITR